MKKENYLKGRERNDETLIERKKKTEIQITVKFSFKTTGLGRIAGSLDLRLVGTLWAVSMSIMVIPWTPIASKRFKQSVAVTAEVSCSAAGADHNF